MVCKNITITGLEDIEADDIITDTISVLSSLYVSGSTNFNNISVHSSLVVSGNNVLNSLEYLIAGVSSLTDLRADNIYTMIAQEQTTTTTLINGVYPTSEIKFMVNTGFHNLISTQNTCYTKIKTDGKLNVFHIQSELLPTRSEGWWNVHDELTQAQRDSIGLRFDVTNLQTAMTETVGALGGAIGPSGAVNFLGGLLGSLTQLIGAGSIVDLFASKEGIFNVDYPLQKLPGTGRPDGMQYIRLNYDTDYLNTNFSNRLTFSDGMKTTINGNIYNIEQLNTNKQDKILNWNPPLSYVSYPTYATTLNFNPNYFEIDGSNSLSFCSTSVSNFYSITVSGPSTLHGTVKMNSNVNISGNVILNSFITCKARFTVSSTSLLNGEVTMNKNVTLISLLNVSGSTLFENQITVRNTLNVIGTSILNDILTCNSKFNVSSTSFFNGDVTMNNNLTINGNWLNIRGQSCGLGIGTSLSALGMASISNAYSTSALTGDTILRSEANLILQSGVANGALIIDTANNTLINGNMTIKSNLVMGSDSKLTTSTIHLANNNLDTENYGARIVSLYNGVNGHNLQIQNRNTPTGTFENNFIISSSGNVSIIKDCRLAANLNVSGGSIFENTMTLNNTLNVSGSSIFQNDMLINANLTARNVSNKSCFYFRCSATGTNFGGQTWYTYDIDLRKYTKIYDMSPASIFRKFTIKTWLRTGNFYYNNGEILENEYSIYMSFMYTYMGGFKIRSFSYVPNNFNNYYLDQLNGTQILLASGDINYIKYLSNVANAVVSCIIQDEL